MAKNICALCKKEKDLIRSHIIPRGLLRLLSVGIFDGQIIAIHPSRYGKPLRRPGGSYSYILCADCDNKIGIYDEYAIKFVESTTLTSDPSRLGWTVENANQKKLKLFCISYLWRASLSSLMEFEEISLGDRHEEKMRVMIDADNAGSTNNYSTLVAKFTSQTNQKLFSKIVMIPATTRLGGVKFYEIYLPNLYKLFVKVDQQVLPKELLKGSLGGSNFLSIYSRGPYENSREYKMLLDASREATEEEKWAPGKS